MLGSARDRTDKHNTQGHGSTLPSEMAAGRTNCTVRSSVLPQELVSIMNPAQQSKRLGQELPEEASKLPGNQHPTLNPPSSTPARTFHTLEH